MICAVDDCTLPARTRGLCVADYQRHRRAGLLPAIEPTPTGQEPWRPRAACANADLDLFFEPSRTPEALDLCLDWALATREEQGILGGTTERQRAAVARTRGIRWTPMKDLPSDRDRMCRRRGCGSMQTAESLCDKHLADRQEARRRQARQSEVVDQARRIIAHVAREHGLDVDEVTGRSRIPQVVLARNEAMAEVRDRLGLSYQRIGVLFDGRDHSTILSAIGNPRQVAA